jgi:glucose/arabinose dehydrogenase
MEEDMSRPVRLLVLLLATVMVHPALVAAQSASNPVCPTETVFYDPGHGEDIVVPEGYKVEVFARDLNFPTGIAFQGNKNDFKVYVVESGTGLPSRCNDNTQVPGGKFSPTNPFTPDLVIFDTAGTRIASGIGKPQPGGGGFQPDGPAIGLAFEKGFGGGKLFASDSNQGVRGAPGSANNTSRLLTIDLAGGKVNPFIVGLPTGDHPTEEVLAHDGWLYWSQGSATNSGVTGHDNGGGGNQHDIACQDIVLSQNLFPPSPDHVDGHQTSGYSNHNTRRPGGFVPAFEDATSTGMCTGAVLRVKVYSKDPQNSIEPFSWGYRNPYGIRFAPDDHQLRGALFVSENGEDERGARPTNNAPDRLHIARQNSDGSPDYHGWPDRFGFLDSTQAVFNPVGGPGDDNPGIDVGNPVRPVLSFPPQSITAPVALEPSDVAAVGLDFAPDSFAHGIVRKGAAFVGREGDFGFSKANGTPEAGHDIELVNFGRMGEPLRLEQTRFAFNCPAANQIRPPGQAARCTGGSEQAFVAHLHGINRPTTAMFGPDGALYLVDYGAVRDFGQGDPDSKFLDPADAPLVQIPGTGVIWKISRTN